MSQWPKRVALTAKIATVEIHLFTGCVMLMNRNIVTLFKWRFLCTEYKYESEDW